MPVDCTADALSESAACLRGIPPGKLPQVMVYLMSVAAGVPADADALLTESACLDGIPHGKLKQVLAYLMCQIANGGSPVACAPQEGADSPVGAATPDFIGQLYHETGDDTYWRSTGLTNADWTEISGGGDCGLIWGPNPLIIENLLGPQIGGVGTTYLFPNLQEVLGDIFIDTDEDSVVSISFPSLVTVGVGSGTGGISIYSANLQTANLPSLVTVAAYFYATSCPVVTIDLGSLETVGQEIELSSNPLLTSLNLSSLQTVGGYLSFSACDLLTSLNLSSLQTVGGYFAGLFLPSISFIDLSSLISIGGNVDVNNSPLLTSFLVPVWVPTDGTIMNFLNCALDVTSVDLILARCVAAGLTTATIDLSGGTNAVPGVQGQLDKTALITAGCSVTTN